MKEHNKLTKTSWLLLAISSFIGFVFLGVALKQLSWGDSWVTYSIPLLLTLMVILNTYFAYLIYKRHFTVLKFCIWLYGLQIIGFETEGWALSLNFGVNASISWIYESYEVTVNLLAMAIFIISFLAYRSVDIGNNEIQKKSAGLSHS